MQTVHSPEVLGTLFDLLLKILEEDLVQKEFSLLVASDNTYFFLMIGAIAPTFKEEAQAAIAHLHIASHDLTSSFLVFPDHATLGLIFRSEDEDKRKELQEVLQEAMLNWKMHFSCQIKIS
jgi:metal-dependent amidase/aminoacylase/carboxypeptidase family protein